MIIRKDCDICHSLLDQKIMVIGQGLDADPAHDYDIRSLSNLIYIY